MALQGSKTHVLGISKEEGKQVTERRAMDFPIKQ